jgi:uncharacterized RDD family membrane protein YckC
VNPVSSPCQPFFVAALPIYCLAIPKKSQLHDLFLRLCWLHEMAAVPSFGHGCGRGGRPVVAQFR